MGKLLPLVLALAGLGAGVGAGFFLKPAPKPTETVEAAADAAAVCPPTGDEDHALPPEPGAPAEFVKLANQFVVPVVVDNDVDSMVVLTLSLEVTQGSQQDIYGLEPKLRDAFLRVLFDHANMGGFQGNFLNHLGLEALRSALREIGQKTAGPILHDVLIVDMVKQAI
jgi:hypothetical protein